MTELYTDGNEAIAGTLGELYGADPHHDAPPLPLLPRRAPARRAPRVPRRGRRARCPACGDVAVLIGECEDELIVQWRGTLRVPRAVWSTVGSASPRRGDRGRLGQGRWRRDVEGSQRCWLRRSSPPRPLPRPRPPPSCHMSSTTSGRCASIRCASSQSVVDGTLRTLQIEPPLPLPPLPDVQTPALPPPLPEVTPLPRSRPRRQRRRRPGPGPRAVRAGPAASEGGQATVPRHAATDAPRGESDAEPAAPAPAVPATSGRRRALRTDHQQPQAAAPAGDRRAADRPASTGGAQRDAQPPSTPSPAAARVAAPAAAAPPAAEPPSMPERVADEVADIVRALPPHDLVGAHRRRPDRARPRRQRLLAVAPPHRARGSARGVARRHRRALRALLPPCPGGLDGLAVLAAYRPARRPRRGRRLDRRLHHRRAARLRAGRRRLRPTAACGARRRRCALHAAHAAPAGRSRARCSRAPSALLQRDLQPEFVTVIAGVYDPSEASCIRQAGHAPPIVLGTAPEPRGRAARRRPLALGFRDLAGSST